MLRDTVAHPLAQMTSPVYQGKGPFSEDRGEMQSQTLCDHPFANGRKTTVYQGRCNRRPSATVSIRENRAFREGQSQLTNRSIYLNRIPIPKHPAIFSKSRRVFKITSLSNARVTCHSDIYPLPLSPENQRRNKWEAISKCPAHKSAFYHNHRAGRSGGSKHASGSHQRPPGARRSRQKLRRSRLGPPRIVSP